MRKPLESNPEIEKKIVALLSEMTWSEKIGQMTQCGAFEETDKQRIREGRLGSVVGVTGADQVNELQAIAVEESRLGIPLLIANDVIHGYRTIFPIPLAEACSWNPELLEETAAVAGYEASSEGIHWIFAPMVDITRDPRWGRIAEGAGEDPYLGAIIAGARVRGFQRNDWQDRAHIMSCPKHFAAYGLAEAGRDYNTVDVSEMRLRETYFPPFQASLEAGAGSMMVAFNELNGIPCSGNKWLLREVLQKEWGFNGVVVSDWESVDELVQHGIAASREEAAQMAAESGVHMDMQSYVYRDHLSGLLAQGKVYGKTIDDAVHRILRMKYRLGLFDRPYTDRKLASSALLKKEHVELARKAARESIVLLKNEGQTLPLSAGLGSLAVIGPLADDQEAMLGCWRGQGRDEDAVSVLQGIRLHAGERAQVSYVKGCHVDESDPEELAQAIQAARQAEAAVLVLGETAGMSGENNSRVSLDLPEAQLELLKAVQETGVPVILILISGRPLSVNWAQEHVPAIVEAWQLGIQAGTAIADVLFGNYNPSGKLPVTFPRSAGQIPIYYSAKRTGRPQMTRYVDSAFTPLYPFGYGLSYTAFEYKELKLSQCEVGMEDSLTVQVQVQNIGGRQGEEIVQLYVCDEVGSVTRPRKELKGFTKISLQPGESREVTFELAVKQLGFFNAGNQYTVEPGTFKVWIGPNSDEGPEGTFTVR